jgi:hypothetical protein
MKPLPGYTKHHASHSTSVPRPHVRVYDGGHSVRGFTLGRIVNVQPEIMDGIKGLLLVFMLAVSIVSTSLIACLALQ